MSSGGQLTVHTMPEGDPINSRRMQMARGMMFSYMESEQGEMWNLDVHNMNMIIKNPQANPAQPTQAQGLNCKMHENDSPNGPQAQQERGGALKAKVMHKVPQHLKILKLKNL